MHMCTMLWCVMYHEQVCTYLLCICLCTQHVCVCCGLSYMRLCIRVCVCIFAALLLDVRACLYICCCLVCLHTLCMELLALLSIKYACAHVLLFSCLFTSMHRCMLLLCICRFVCWLRASDRPHAHSKGADHTGTGTSGGGHHWDRVSVTCRRPRMWFLKEK